MRPSCAFNFRPREGAGNAGCPLHPQPPVQCRKHRGRSHRYPGTPGIPCAMVLTAYVVLSPVTGLFCHRRLRIKVLSLPGRADKTSARLDASVGASGPHDFAVRDSISRPRASRSLTGSLRTRPATPSRAQRCRVHRIPHPTSVTIMIRPSCGTGWQGF